MGSGRLRSRAGRCRAASYRWRAASTSRLLASTSEMRSGNRTGSAGHPHEADASASAIVLRVKLTFSPLLSFKGRAHEERGGLITHRNGEKRDSDSKDGIKGT